MPKRRIRDQCLHGVRIELNEKERELLETAIYVRGASATIQGLGTAIAGLGIPLGIIGGVIIWKEGTGWFDDLMKEDKRKFLDENCTQVQYDAYLNERTEEWIEAASAAGRYAPAIGDADNYSAWHALDASAGPVWQPLTFQEWEADTYDEPPMTFDAWCNEKMAGETVKRRAIVGTLFPPLTLLGIGQYGFKDWFTGRK
jgi:hypothetical protein